MNVLMQEKPCLGPLRGQVCGCDLDCRIQVVKKLLGKTSGNSLTMGINSMERISETKYLTLTIWYKQPFEIILQALRQEIM